MERIPALHQRWTASQGAGSLSVLRWCLLTGSFIRSFIPKYLWVPRPCQEGSGHRDSTNITEISLSGTYINPN